MKYVRNEWMKLWSQKGTWVMLILLAAVIIGYGTIEKVYDTKNNASETWRENVQENLNLYKSWAEEGDEGLDEEILKMEYQLENDISSGYVTTFSDMVGFGSAMLTLATIFSVVIAAGIVSTEFGTGTVKMLLTRPVKRWKILLSKLVAVILYGLTLFVVGLALSSLVGLILFGTSTSVELQVVDGVVKELSPWSYMFEEMFLSFGDFFLSIIFAFLIGSLFKSSSLAVGVTLITMLMGSVIVSLLTRFSFTKYVWLAHSDLTQHMDGRVPVIEGTTLGFSIGVLIVYAVIFLAITFISFNKRDVTA
ncbi:MAG: ABC transporter permease [Lysinibacillus sp.]